MNKNILILNSSPRPHGNTESLVDEFIRGASESEHSIKNFFENLMLNANHNLKNRYMHIDYNAEQNDQSRIQSATNEKPKCQNGTLECTLEELALLKIMKENPTITQKEMAVRSGMSERSLKRRTVEMQDKD